MAGLSVIIRIMAERLLISQVAELLNRRPNTVRGWDRENLLPEDLKANRDEKGFRYWTYSQVEGIREWLKDTDRRPGRSLKNYNPSEEEIEQHILRSREARLRREEEDD